jgi:hypothetical protein
MVLYCDGRCGGRKIPRDIECNRDRAEKLWLFAKASGGRGRLINPDVVWVSAHFSSEDPELLKFGSNGDEVFTELRFSVLPHFSGSKGKGNEFVAGALRERPVQIRVQRAIEPREALVVLKAQVWSGDPNRTGPVPDSDKGRGYSAVSPQVQEIRINVRCGLPAIDGLSRDPFRYKIAISYAAENGELVKAVAGRLASSLGEQNLFLDSFLQSHLADARIRSTLRRAFEDQSQLVVVFLSEEFSKSEWCTFEMECVRRRILDGDARNVMFVSLDRTTVPGFDPQWGSMRAEGLNNEQICKAILDRFYAESCGGSGVC